MDTVFTGFPASRDSRNRTYVLLLPKQASDHRTLPRKFFVVKILINKPDIGKTFEKGYIFF